MIGGGTAIIIIVIVVKLLLDSDRAHWVRAWWMIDVTLVVMVVATWVHATWIYVPGRQGVVVEDWRGQVAVYENTRLLTGQKVAGRFPFPWCVHHYRHYPLGSVGVAVGSVRLTVSVDRERTEKLLVYSTDLGGRRALRHHAEQIVRDKLAAGHDLPAILKTLEEHGLKGEVR